MTERERPSPAEPSRDRQVAVVIEASNAYARGLLEGMLRHVRAHEHWTFFIPEHGRGLPPLEALSLWHGDGVIARIETKEIATVLKRLRRHRPLAIVDVSAARLLPDVPYVETDDVAIAHVAIAHFLDRHFRHLAFIGDDRFQWSSNRRDAFIEDAARAGHDVSIYRQQSKARGDSGESEDESIERWIASLPKPVAIFACYDIRGRQVIDACRRAKISVPDEVAVLGVDDDPILCRLANPPLSSVIPDAIGAGALAAATLAQLMRGETVEKLERLLPPLGISTRQSTDVFASDDKTVVAAVQFIRTNACSGIKVDDVVRDVGISRRLLEQRFTKIIGRTLHEEIVRVQFARVEQLLRETDLPLSAIAHRCGFRHTEYLTVAFTRRNGISPGRWRQQCQAR